MNLRNVLSTFSLLATTMLVTGCAMENTNPIDFNVASSALNGKLMGGQNPIVGATISVYTYGTGGYGSAGTSLASTTTDARGNFAFASGAYTCPQTDTPVYLISVGGDSGSGVNPNSVLAASLGACSGASSQYVVLNEVTTMALAYSMSHFFTGTLGAGTGTADQHDSIGGPSTTAGTAVTYSKGLQQGNSTSYGLLAINSNGLAQVSDSVMTAEPLKVYSLANIIATCVNSAGQTSILDTTSPCGQLFNLTQPPGALTRPSDTLQAAVQIALYPTQNVAALYALPNTRVAFPNSLTSQPNDWSLAVSYTASNMGLGVDTGNTTTIDIDANGHVWFPSTAAGHVGVGYYDPANAAFFGPYNGTNMVHPGQVAIDASGYIWVSDTGSAILSGYNTAAPTTYTSLTLANSTSHSVTVAGDSTVKVGAVVGKKVKLASVDTARTTYADTGVTVPNTAGVLAKLASDASGNLAAVFGDNNGTQAYAYRTSAGTSFTTMSNNTDNVGQVAYNGYDLFGVLQYDGKSTHLANSFCYVSGVTATNCYALGGTAVNDGAVGLAVDGAGTAWVADNANATVRSAPYFNATTHTYLNASNLVTTNILNHNSSNGSTLGTPAGIAIDSAGNVWVSNSGCTGSGCTPGSFVLTQIIGAAAPAITPVSGQITGGNLAGTQPTN